MGRKHSFKYACSVHLAEGRGQGLAVSPGVSKSLGVNGVTLPRPDRTQPRQSTANNHALMLVVRFERHVLVI